MGSAEAEGSGGARMGQNAAVDDVSKPAGSDPAVGAATNGRREPAAGGATSAARPPVGGGTTNAGQDPASGDPNAGGTADAGRGSSVAGAANPRQDPAAADPTDAGQDPAISDAGAPDDTADATASIDVTASIPVCESAAEEIAGGTYTVPVPERLSAYSSYTVGSITFCKAGDSVQLDYSLPELLLGKKERVQLRGGWNASTPSLDLSGDATANCVVSGSTWTCTEHFAAVTLDVERLQKELADLPDAERQARFEVSQIFGQDPIGILEFSLP